MLSVGVGGARYTALGDKLWVEVAQRHLLPKLPGGTTGPPGLQTDSRKLLLDHLLDRARAEAAHIAVAPLAALRAIKTTMLDGQREQVAAARRREDRAFAITFGFDPAVLEA